MQFKYMTRFPEVFSEKTVCRAKISPFSLIDVVVVKTILKSNPF